MGGMLAQREAEQRLSTVIWREGGPPVLRRDCIQAMQKWIWSIHHPAKNLFWFPLVFKLLLPFCHLALANQALAPVYLSSLSMPSTFLPLNLHITCYFVVHPHRTTRNFMKSHILFLWTFLCAVHSAQIVIHTSVPFILHISIFMSVLPRGILLPTPLPPPLSAHPSCIFWIPILILIMTFYYKASRTRPRT